MSSTKRNGARDDEDDWSHSATGIVASFANPYDAFFWLAGASERDVQERLRAALQNHGHRRPRFECVPEEDVEQAVPAYMVFDVETDGGKGKQLAVQLAFVVFDCDHREIYTHNKLLRLPAGRKINWHSVQVHKITDNKLHLRGVQAGHELFVFFEWADRVRKHGGTLVAHNASFDASVITNTATTNGLKRHLSCSDCFCTMRASTQFAGLVDRRGRAKPPKNDELYLKLHGVLPEWARLHDALDDCRVTACSYRAGCEALWWKQRVPPSFYEGTPS